MEITSNFLEGKAEVKKHNANEAMKKEEPVYFTGYTFIDFIYYLLYPTLVFEVYADLHRIILSVDKI